MKNIRCISLMAALAAIGGPRVFADGGVIIRDADMWQMLPEKEQYCAISYRNRVENMILSVGTAKELHADAALWVFPIPSLPQDASVDIGRGFPEFEGESLSSVAGEQISNAFTMMRATQLWTFPEFGVLGRKVRNIFVAVPGVVVHQSVQKMGLTAELLTAKDSRSLTGYLQRRGVRLPPNFDAILRDYIGKHYSFVMGWISDIAKYVASQRQELQSGTADSLGLNLGLDRAQSVLSLRIRFKADRIYYPLKPTSVYGDLEIPAVIYVTGHVQPEFPPGMEAEREVEYFERQWFVPEEQFRDFFGAAESPDFNKYTKVKISGPSRKFKEDLWMSTFSLKAQYLKFLCVARWPYVPLHALCSCLASLLAGMGVFRKYRPSPLKLFVFGLFNFLTLIGVFVAVKAIKIRTRFAALPDPDLSGPRRIGSDGDYLFAFSVLFVFLTAVLQLLLYATL